MRVVIVEDEIRIREGIKKLLLRSKEKYNIVGEADNGQNGLSIIRKTKPDLVITDVRMPFMDGLEMLKLIYQEGITAKAIVLSAYTEFEYARTAIKLGVTEYLLKPIVIDEFTDALRNVRERINCERLQKPEQVGSLEQLLGGILNGSISLEEEIIDYLDKRYDLGRSIPISVMSVYLEQWDYGRVLKIRRNITSMMAQKNKFSYVILDDEKRQLIELIIFGYGMNENIHRWIQSYILQEKRELAHLAIVWNESNNIYSLQKDVENMYKYLDWNISLGNQIIISCSAVKHIQLVPCVYPLDIESDMKEAVCGHNEKILHDCIEKFHNYFCGEKIYDPKIIKEHYVRFLWVLILISAEIGRLEIGQIEQQRFLKQITQAKTKRELIDTTKKLVNKSQQVEQEQVNNRTVKRALSLIHEFYQNGITLEEISAKLEITPEYLGSQFHREIGSTFSTYMKSFRINKAKELLLGTSLKLYKIAELTGYADPKYFSKVFKEVTGYLPVEYRKLHK